MNTAISISNQTNFVENSVGQLAKTPLPTLNPLSTTDLEVRRHTEKKPHTRPHAGGFFDLNEQKANKIKPFKLYKTAENDFIQTIPLLFEQVENTTVVFHNPNFVTSIFEAYHTMQAHLFLDWVKTFAIIRKSGRAILLDDVIQSTDEDFLTALQLFKLQNTKPKKKPQKQAEKIWQAIVKHFPNQPFGSREIENITLIPSHTVTIYLRQFNEEGKLKKCKKQRQQKRYQLM